MSSLFRYGGAGSGASNGLDPSSSYRVDLRSTYHLRSHLTDFGIFAQVNLLQLKGSAVDQTSNEVMVGLELKFGTRFKVPWDSVNHSGAIP